MCLMSQEEKRMWPRCWSRRSLERGARPGEVKATDRLRMPSAVGAGRRLWNKSVPGASLPGCSWPHGEGSGLLPKETTRDKVGALTLLHEGI